LIASVLCGDELVQAFPYLKDFCTVDGYTSPTGTYILCNPDATNIPNPVPKLASSPPQCYQYMELNPKTNYYTTPATNVSGNCSGFAKFNMLEDWIFYSNYTPASSFWQTIYLPYYLDAGCGAPGQFVYKTNSVPGWNYGSTAPTPQDYPRFWTGQLEFNDEDGINGPQDFGVDDPSSNVYQHYPNWYSCPRRLVGPQTSPFAMARGRSATYKKLNRHPPSWKDRRRPVDPPETLLEVSIAQYVKKFKRPKRWVSVVPRTQDIPA
jgi:hypothetical protein